MRNEHRDGVRLGDLIAFLRWLRGGWTKARLARKTGIDESQLSRYEAGVEPKAPNLQRILSAFGVSFQALEYIRWILRLLRGLMKTGGRALEAAELPGRSAGEPGAAESRTLARLELAMLSGPRGTPAAPTDEDRRRVDALWQWLKGLPDRRRRFFIQGTRSFGGWLLGLRLCKASEDAAAADPAEAAELAELALFAMEHTDAPEAFKAAFTRAWKLRREGEDEQGLLSEARLLELEASLLRDQPCRAS
jgi:transcriptional regulator with XRE-family HTH domain